MRPPRHAPSLVAIAVGLAMAAGFAEDLRPSWQCLPDDTAVMLRMPDPAGFLEAVRTRTRFGAVALDERRLDGLWNVFLAKLRADGAEEELDRFDEQLGTYGLSRDDLKGMFRGDMGAGMVLRGRGADARPVTMLLAWLEPGEESAARLVEAAKRKLADDAAKDEADAARRIDVEMAGHEVLWAVERVMSTDLPRQIVAPGADPGDDSSDDPPGDEKPEQVGVSHVFLARIGGRLLVGQTMPAIGPPAGQPAEARDFDAECGTEEAKGIFERFLAAHADGGEAPLAAVLDTAGMAAALPGGTPLSEVIIDPRVFRKTIGDELTEKRMADVGLGSLGPMAWRQSLDAGRYHSGMFVSLPAPRTSLMRILDQPCDAAEIPSFVTREAIDLTQISLDLGAAYETVKEFAIGQGGPETGNMFTAVEMQAQGWLGVDLPRLLASLGTRHWIVTYPPRVAEALAEAREARGEQGGPAVRQVADRAAVVWQIDDEAPFVRILQRLAGLAGGGELQEEQGFRGVRIPDGPAVYMGQGHLVVAIGKDSLEKTLTAIRNPPAGEASLRESDVVRRAGELLPLEPARMFGVNDSSLSGGTLGMLREMAAAMVPDDVEPSYRDMLAGIQRLLPGGEEMEGMFGVGATTMRADDAGVSLQSVWEMPAP